MSALGSLYAAAEKGVRPLRATVELTRRCHLKCQHCYLVPRPTEPDGLTLPVLRDLFAQMADAGGFFLTLTGGEIALRTDLFAILEAAAKHHFAVKLLSSGTLWQEQEWDGLASLGVMSVRLSVYGASAETHDRLTRSPGSLAKTLATARGLRDRGVDLELACPMTRINASELPEVRELADSFGASLHIDPTITRAHDGNEAPLAVSPRLDDLVEAYRDPEIAAQIPEPSSPTDDRPCGVGEHTTFVCANGDVLPCVNWPQAADNILSTPYLEIYQNSELFRYCRALRRQDLLDCNACGLLSSCKPCAAMNLADTGTVGEHSPLRCDSARATAAVRAGRHDLSW